MRGRAHILIPLFILAAALMLRIVDPAPVQQLRLLVFDTYQKAKPRTYDVAKSPVRIIDIDDESLARLGQWPWPRTRMAEIVDRLGHWGAAAITFDMVFAEPDRTSPEQVLPLWPQTTESIALAESVAGAPSHDDAFAAAIRRVRAVTGFVLTDQTTNQPPAVKARFAHAGDDPRLFLNPFPGAVINLPQIEQAATGNGSMNIRPDPDNVVRRAPLILRYRDALYPSLLSEALRVAQGAKTHVARASGASGESAFGQHTGLNAVKIGAFAVPTDARGQILIYFTPSSPDREIPAWRLLEPGYDGSGMAGSIVFIGTSAAGLKDLRATPLGTIVPGVEIHAQVIEQIISGVFLTRPDWSMGAELLFLLALGLLLMAVARFLSAVWAALFGLIAVAGAIASSWLVFEAKGMLFDPIYPSITAFLFYLAQTVIGYLHTERERQRVRGAFSRYMGQDLVEQLAAHPGRLVLGGEMKEMTLLFCDIRGFTAISEQFDAAGLTRFINRFLTPMSEIIMRHRGTIDKYMGDCIMAFWNAPLDDPEHARHGCQAALAMREKLAELNREWRREAASRDAPFEPIRVGIGINTGMCCVGNMGSEQRFDYSVLGDDVNLASRLEGQSTTYGVDVVLGENTRAAVPDLTALELDLIRVKGRARPARIFTLLDGVAASAEPSVAQLLSDHSAMLAAYRGQDWEEAGRLLERCAAADPTGELGAFYALYRQRIADYRVSPPGPGWDGVYVATAK